MSSKILNSYQTSYSQPRLPRFTLPTTPHSTDYISPYRPHTYQAYLTDCMPRLRLDLERARREGWQFGAKLVRGQPQPWSAANLIRHMSCDPTITPCTRAATLCTQAATPCMPPGAWGVHGARARARSGAGVRLTLSPSPHSSLIVRLSLNRYEDPIQPTAEATHANYREALQLLLRPPRRASTLRVPPLHAPQARLLHLLRARLAPLDRHSQGGAQHARL